ncbi:MAG: EVE domain-containing protein [Candidatus Hodarchaeales archaeon]|jgi:hypothetical protein
MVKTRVGWQFKIEPLLFKFKRYYKNNINSSYYTWNQRQATKEYLYDHFFENEIKMKVKKGDKAIIWIHANIIGIYAIGEVYEDPVKLPILNNKMKYYVDDDDLNIEYHNIKINILHDMFDNPVPHNVCYNKGLARYRDNFLGGILGGVLNPKLPIKYNSYPRPFPQMLNIKYDFKDYQLGKLDIYGWIPIKPIDENLWKKILDLIK